MEKWDCSDPKQADFIEKRKCTLKCEENTEMKMLAMDIEATWNDLECDGSTQLILILGKGTLTSDLFSLCD